MNYKQQLAQLLKYQARYKCKLKNWNELKQKLKQTTQNR